MQCTRLLCIKILTPIKIILALSLHYVTIVVTRVSLSMHTTISMCEPFRVAMESLGDSMFGVGNDGGRYGVQGSGGGDG